MNPKKEVKQTHFGEGSMESFRKEMNPGPELDALIAEKVMGPDFACDNCGELLGCGCLITEIGSGLPPYSTDISAAWEVVDKMIENPEPQRHGIVRIEVNIEQYRYQAWFGPHHKNTICLADTAPHAICLAALKAKGVSFEAD